MAEQRDQPAIYFGKLWQRIHPAGNLRDAMAEIACVASAPFKTRKAQELGEHAAGSAQARRLAIDYARQLNLSSVAAWLDDQDALSFEQNSSGDAVLGALQRIWCLVRIFGDGSEKPLPGEYLIGRNQNKQYAAQYASYLLYRMLYDHAGTRWSPEEIRSTAQRLADHLNRQLFSGTPVMQVRTEGPFNSTYYKPPTQSHPGSRNVRPLMLSLADPEGGPATSVICEWAPEPTFPIERTQR